MDFDVPDAAMLDASIQTQHNLTTSSSSTKPAGGAGARHGVVLSEIKSCHRTRTVHVGRKEQRVNSVGENAANNRIRFTLTPNLAQAAMFHSFPSRVRLSALPSQPYLYL